MKRCVYIYNPAAKGGRSESDYNTLQNLVSKLPDSRLFYSTSQRDISECVEELLPKYDVFIACGGDGTVREVASGLMRTNKTLGIIPMGTGNDLCKSLNIPTNILQAFEMVHTGKTTAIDVGCCNDFIFLNTLGFGFDGLTNRYAYEMSNILPIFRYALAALKAARNQEVFSADIVTKNEKRKKSLLMVTFANGCVEGGKFWVAPEASINDGKLNLITLKPLKSWLIPILLPLLLVKKGAWIPQFEMKWIERAIIKFEEPVQIHADGEIIKSDVNEYQINILPKALNVICGL